MNEKINDVTNDLRIIAYDTGLKLNRAKDFSIIKHLYRRVNQERERYVPGKNPIAKQNTTSLYLTMYAFNNVCRHS